MLCCIQPMHCRVTLRELKRISYISELLLLLQTNHAIVFSHFPPCPPQTYTTLQASSRCFSAPQQLLSAANTRTNSLADSSIVSSARSSITDLSNAADHLDADGKFRLDKIGIRSVNVCIVQVPPPKKKKKKNPRTSVACESVRDVTT